MGTPATPAQIAAVKMAGTSVPVRILAEQVGLSKSTVHRLRRDVAEVTANGSVIVITRRAQ